MRIWLLALIGLAALVAILPFAPAVKPIFNEGGPIETPSAILLFASALGLLLMRPVHRVLHLVLLCLLLAEREFDNELLPEGAWLRESVGWIEDNILRETIPAAILAVLLVLGLWKFSWPHIKNGALWRSDVGRLLVLGVAFAVLGQFAGEGLKHFGDGLSEVNGTRLYVIEELSEFFFAIAVALATYTAVSRDRRKRM